MISILYPDIYRTLIVCTALPAISPNLREGHSILKGSEMHELDLKNTSVIFTFSHKNYLKGQGRNSVSPIIIQGN